MNKFAFLLSMLLIVGLSACAATPPQVNRTVEISPGLSLGVYLPSDRWTMTSEIPEFLVEDRAEHIEHELAEKGQKVSRDQLLDAARKRLAANELFIFNPASKASMEIDFSPLKDGEAAPSRRTVAASARYAGDSLSQEEGVSEARFSDRKADVFGARDAYRLDADYKHHDEKTRFLGIVGFAAPYWFYAYYTDHLAVPSDHQEMDRIVRSLLITVEGQ